MPTATFVDKAEKLRIKPLFDTVNCLQLVYKYLDYIRLVQDLALNTCASRRVTLMSFCNYSANPSISYITLGHVDSFLMYRRETCMASTVNLDKQALRSFFEYCQTRLNIVLSFDYTMIKRSRERSAPVKTFNRHIIAGVVAGCSKRIDALMIALLYETGMRIGELANLQVDDIRDNEIKITGKGGWERPVIMTHALASAVREHLVERNISRGYVFQPLQAHSNHRNVRYTTCTIRERIQAAFARYGIKMHPHQLRHSFAINWLTSGGDVRTLQKLLGHGSLDTTMRYLGITDGHLNEEYRKRMKQSVINIVDY